METLITGLAAILLAAFAVIMSCLRGTRFGDHVLIYEIASVLLVAVLLLLGSAAGYAAARFIALLFLALSIIGGYALILLYWMLTPEARGERGGDP